MISLREVSRRVLDNGIWDFTDGISEHNQVTCALPYNAIEQKAEKLGVCMNSFSMYSNIGFAFYVRLQIYYNEGRNFLYTTGIISPNGYFIQNDVVEVIVRYCLPVVEFIPMDHNEYGNNEKSKLAMYGYNVRKNELSEIQRRNILDFVLKYNLMTKSDITNLLERNIRFCHGYNAKNTWERDIQYVREQ